MNKKQVVKVSYMTKRVDEPSEQEKYGIVIDENRILLEDAKIACLAEDRFGILRGTVNLGVNEPETLVNIPSYEPARNFQVSATRNVNPDIRAALEQNYTTFVRYEVLWKQLTEMQNEANALKKNIETLPTIVREARGLMSGDEFASEVYDNLTDKVKHAMEDGSRKRDYHGNHPSYSIGYNPYNKTVEIRLDIDIEKYFRKASFIYEEYDGTIFLAEGAEKDTSYRRYLNEYSSPLPIKQKPEEGLSVGGDKDFLSYHCVYQIKADKQLTKEYAAKIANDFCKSKTRDKGEER